MAAAARLQRVPSLFLSIFFLQLNNLRAMSESGDCKMAARARDSTLSFACATAAPTSGTLYLRKRWVRV
jgi:hypothetical protein